MGLSDNLQRSVQHIGPRHLIGAALLYLALCWLIFFGVDTYDWLGFHGGAPVEEGRGLIWLTIFANGGPTEWIQWSVLGAAGVVAAWVAGNARREPGEESIGWFWLLMSVAFTLMLIEDAGELRQKVWAFVNLFVESRRVDLVLEFMQFMVLASVPLFALWRYGGRVLRQRGIGFYVLGGFFFYAIAGGASATRNWGGGGEVPGWYTVAGETIHGWIGGAMTHPTYEQELVYFLLMDRIFEESLELMGAFFFLAATVMAARSLRTVASAAAHPGSRAA